MWRACSLQLRRSTVRVSFLIYRVRLHILPTRSRWLKFCFVIEKIIVRLSWWRGLNESSLRLCRGYSRHNLTTLEQRAMLGRFLAINDKLSEVVKQSNGDKHKFQDETELEFAQHMLCTSRCGRRSTEKYCRTSTSNSLIACRDCKHGDQPSATSCTLGKQYIGLVHQQGPFAPEKHGPKDLDKADEWKGWEEEVADYVGTMTPAMKQVLAEIDKKTDVIYELWRHPRRTK